MVYCALLHVALGFISAPMLTRNLVIANRSRARTKMTFKSHSGSPDMSLFDIAHVIYYRFIVTMTLSCIVSHSQIFFENRETYKPHLIQRPVSGDPVGISQIRLVGLVQKLEWCGYHMLTKVR